MFDDFYGLGGKPFQLTPDPAFYFESATHRKALSYLGYGLAQGEGFVVITGEVGAGKSTLVAYLMATIDPARMTAATVVTSALDGEEIVHVVAQSFGLAVAGHDKASALGAIETFLHEEARAGRRCLLIVDEAQNLSVGALEELRMLSNFQLGAHPLLQTLLLGQPEFRDTLLHSTGLEQLRQRVIATHHLAAMEPREVQTYVEHRLTCVGWTGRPAFDAEVFAHIHQATGGIPRRINQILNRLLLLGSVEQRDHIGVDMLDQVLAELDDDGALALMTVQAEAAKTPDALAQSTAAQVSDPSSSFVPAPAAPIVAGLDANDARALIEQALADRDAQIAELQSALVELAATIPPRQDVPPMSDNSEQVAALEAQLAEATANAAKLEARLGDTERTLRHALTMLIEWIESGDSQRQAA